MFFEKFGEGWDGNIEGIGVEVVFKLCNCSLFFEIMRFLQLVDGWFWFGINFVLKGVKRFGIGVVEELLFLKEE